MLSNDEFITKNIKSKNEQVFLNKIYELFSKESSMSCRVKLNNLKNYIIENIQLCDLYFRGFKQHLSVLGNEFRKYYGKTLNGDIILSDKQPALNRFLNDSLTIGKQVNDSEKVRYFKFNLEFLLSKIDKDYLLWITERLLELLDDENEDISLLLKVSDVWATELINVGWSMDYIRISIYNLFKEEFIDLHSFIMSFTKKKDVFDIYLPLNNIANVVTKFNHDNYQFKSNVDMNEILNEKVANIKDRTWLHINDIFANDHFSAANIGYNTEYKKLMNILCINYDLQSSNPEICYSKNSSSVMQISTRFSHNFDQSPFINPKIDYNTKIYKLIVRKNDENSKKLYSSIKGLNSVRVSLELEDKFIQSWNLLDAFSKKSGEKDGIVQIRELVSNSRSVAYLYNMIREFMFQKQYISDAALRKEFSQKFKSTKGANTFLKYLLNDYSGLIKYFDGNSYLSYKLSALSNVFNNPKTLQMKIREYNDRISWQIHRIYVVRNVVFHDGKTYFNLEYLLENLRQYHIELLRTTINNIINCDQEIDIETVFHKYDSDYDLILCKLQLLENYAFTSTEYLAILKEIIGTKFS